MKINFLAILMLLGFALNGFSQTWEKLNTGFDYIFKGIEFPGGQGMIGFAGGQSVTYMGDGVIIKTTDGGSTWNQLWTGADQGIEGICFTDLNTGYVCGWSAYFAKTTNGGLNWTVQNPSSDAYYYTDLVFKDATHGIAVGQTNTSIGAVYSTSDGGNTWVVGSGLSGIPYKVSYVSANTYFLVNNSGDIQKSTDGGLTWTTVYASGGVLAGIDFNSPTTGIACGDDGMIVKTYDGGVTWTQQILADGYPIWHDAAWKGQNEVYVVGTPEYIYKSSDGGVSWIDDYPLTTGIPALYEVLFTIEGRGYIIGSQGWFYRLVPEFTAAFAANSNHVCNGGTVQFTDQSIGSPSGWNWTFEGGTPSTSTVQNPVVTYTNPGVYNVKLVISLGAYTDTVLKTDLIHVEVPVTLAPTQPSGLVELCGLAIYDYTTTSVPEATGYSWISTPAAAGTFSGSGIVGTLAASNTWNGSFSVKVSGSNACGDGPVSEELFCSLHHQPVIFSLFSGGGYCAGQAGYEIKLEDSEIGVDYQLYKDGNASGPALPGTGNMLSFGYQEMGNYTVSGSNGYCSADMQGIAAVFLIDLPATPTQPEGPSNVCNNIPSTYTGTLPANGFSLFWILNPSASGTISQPSLTSATISWNPDFSGTAEVSVQGQNECGNGPATLPLQVNVNPVPQPVISGSTTVCHNWTADYVTAYTAGNTYLWTVTGGNIVSGAGTAAVIVKWTSIGTGTITVIESTPQNCSGTSLSHTVIVEPCVGVEDQASTPNLTVYPNPVTGILFVKFPDCTGKTSELNFIDPAGRIVLKYSFDNSMNNIEKLDVTNLKSGYYLLKCLVDGVVVSQTKIIKN